MRIYVNTQMQDVPEGTSLYELLQMLKYKNRKTWAWVDGKLIPSNARKPVILKEGSMVEIVPLGIGNV